MKLALSFIVLTTLAHISVGQNPAPPVTEATIKADMLMHVCKNGDRLEAVKNLFKARGATDEELKVEKRDSVENLVVTKKGRTDEVIIVGAHYDKVPDGCGAIDNWTGIVIIANLFSTLRNITTDKTILFVAFGKEEQGLVGSHAMAKSISKEKVPQFCSMINLDSFGFSYPQVLTNTSSDKMTKLAKELAQEVKMPYADASLAGVADADSSSFVAKGIPAITFHGLSYKWPQYLHSSKDKLDNVNYQSVLVGYNFVALYLSRVEPKPCNAFRK